MASKVSGKDCQSGPDGYAPSMKYKYGVVFVAAAGPTVVAIDAGSNLKKVNRKAILEVNVPKTCDVIINPEVPMALRLQSNLLYGVSRVYLQQCGYTLSDAQNVQANLKMLSNIIRTASLDPNAGKARPDQLVLEDDPAFVPDMVLPRLDLDLAALEISSDATSHQSSILSAQSHRTSISSHDENDASMLGLVIPSSDDGGAGDLAGFVVPSSDRMSVRHNAVAEDLIREAEDDFNFDPGFIFDNDGNLIVTGDESPPLQADQAQIAVGRIRSDSAASAQVRRELEEGMRAGQVQLGDPMDLDVILPRADDENLMLPQAEAFPPFDHQARAGTGFLRSSAVPQGESSSETALARQQRKPRGRKVLPSDPTQELRNSDLAQWHNDYLANMENAKKAKLHKKASATAKHNAASWVFGAGIGGVGLGRGPSQLKGPLADMFAGDALMQALTGNSTSAAGKKRSQSGSEADGTDAEERRVRMREGEEEFGRTPGFHLEDDDTLALLGNEAIELGRHEQPAMEDSLQMPWNRSASARESRYGSVGRGQGFGSSIGGFTASGGRPSSLPVVGGPGSMDRRASRITSASPLVGRGQERSSDLEIPQFDENELLGGPSTSVAGDEFQLLGPAAAVDTQTAAQSQWMRATLDTESNNFLDFVKDEISGKVPPINEAGDEASQAAAAPSSVFFEQLLPPTQNSKVVAAQAFLHVLALATKGMLEVEQNEDYGPIQLGLVPGI
ncbi:MAG: hypothetical protein Q9182_000087 [Xanthomendoza sp. 2 TL-2023]